MWTYAEVVNPNNGSWNWMRDGCVFCCGTGRAKNEVFVLKIAKLCANADSNMAFTEFWVICTFGRSGT